MALAYTTRLKPDQRNRFYGTRTTTGAWVMEPALGTLEERLEILGRRFGEKQIRLTRAERQDYAEWLRQNGLENQR